MENSNVFKPIEIIEKDTSSGIVQSGGDRVVFPFLLSEKPGTEWNHIFEEKCKGRFVDAAFSIRDDRLEIHLGNPKELPKAYVFIKNTVLPRTNDTYNLQKKEERKKWEKKKEESNHKLEQGQQEFDNLQI